MPNKVLDQFINNGSLIWTVTGITASIVVILALIWFVIKTKRPLEDRLVERSVRDHSMDYVRNIVLSDGLYGYYFIDYLILQPSKIIVLGMEHVDGYIFGSEQVVEWAQVLNKQSKNFPNPLLQIDLYVQAIQSIISGVELVGRVVFTSECSFPKGIPANVMNLDNMSEKLAKLNQEDVPALDLTEKWNFLLDVAKQQKQQFIREGK